MGSGGCCGGGGCGSGSSAGSCSTESEVVTPKAASTATFEGTDDAPLTVTDAAVEAVKSAIKEEGQEGDGLRVSVVGGGCSGYQYALDFEREERMGDIVQSFGGINFYIDAVSAGYLKGTIIDYVSGLNGTGFKFNNPNAKRTCGCGSSFA